MASDGDRVVMTSRLRLAKRTLVARLTLLATLSCAAPTLAGCVGQHVSLNYVVEATVKVGDEIATGSSVWSMEYYSPGRFWLDSMGPHLRTTGEAVPIKLADGRYVFVLRRHGAFSNPDYGGFPLNCVGNPGEPDKFLDALARFQGPCQVDRNYPTLVIFPDRNDSTQYERVEPTALQARSKFCASICLLDLTVRATKEPITTGLENLLPWLTTLGNRTDIQHLHTSSGAYPILLYLVDFSTPLSAAASAREEQDVHTRLSK